jgi:hypothetical protein
MMEELRETLIRQKRYSGLLWLDRKEGRLANMLLKDYRDYLLLNEVDW